MDARTVADQLIAAEHEHRTIEPFTDRFPFLREEQAYAAQWLVVQNRIDHGERLVGAKLGMTSQVVQRALNVAEPVYGWLTSGMLAEPGESMEGRASYRPAPNRRSRC
jgi:2-keto-4-pentenoate hydratase